MSLQAGVVSTIKKYVFESLHKQGSWKILVMDDRATQILSSVFRMRDLMEFGISSAESLYRSRQRFKTAVYIITPNRREVDLLINDFRPDCMKYLEAHVFFLYECPRDVLLTLAASNAMRYIKTLSQLDMDFIPIESSVYTFESRETSYLYPLPAPEDQERKARLLQLAERLSTVCVILNEYPRICCHKTDANLELARLLQTKLDVYHEANPSMGQGPHKDKSILLILDRGFDPISPILHELTLQAVCYDLLHVENNMVTYDENRKANVTDEDQLWRELRHLHIAQVSTILPNRIREFAESKKKFAIVQSSEGSTNEGFVNESGDTKTKELGLQEMADLIKDMPQYQVEAARYTAVSKILKACMDIFRDKVADLCHAEQDLVMGQTSKGEALLEPMRLLSDILKHDTGSSDDRLRLVMLYVLIKDGTSENHLEKLLSVARVDAINKALFVSLSLLVGAQLIIPDPYGFGSIGSNTTSTGSPLRLSQYKWYQQLPPVSAAADRIQVFLPARGKRKNRVDSNSYTVSRWSPYLLDVIEGAIAGTLDKSQFDFIGGTENRPKQQAPVTPTAVTQRETPRGPSARFQPAANPASSKNPSALTTRSPTSSFRGRCAKSEHCGPRLIVCIVGGVTWSETRTAYQITEKCIETRLAESDRHAAGRTGQPIDSTILPGGGGSGWNWEVVIGGTHILTPESFIGDLENISHLAASNTPSGDQASAQNSGTRRSSAGRFHL